MTASEAFCRIGTGRRQAVRRPSSPSEDRIFRKMVEQARLDGRVIISGPDGYYEPDFADPVDLLEYNAYMARERLRIRSKIATQKAMLRAASLAISEQLRMEGT